jgi:hypothetical protein
MSEETTQDTGSQEVASAAPAASVGFFDSLPEDLRAEPSLRNFTDPVSLAKSYVHAQRMIGADKIPLPGKSATDDEWRQVYKRLGAPDSAKGYDFKVSPDAMRDTEIEAFRAAAFEAGLNGKQAGRIAQFLEGTVTQSRAAMEESLQAVRYEGEQELRQEWGQAFDQQVQLAHKAAVTFLGNTDLLDTVELADGRLLGDHPAIVKMFANLAKEIGEDNLLGDASELVMTPAEAQNKISEMTRQGTPYWDKFHPEHRAYVDEALRLREYM